MTDWIDQESVLGQTSIFISSIFTYAWPLFFPLHFHTLISPPSTLSPPFDFLSEHAMLYMCSNRKIYYLEFYVITQVLKDFVNKPVRPVIIFSMSFLLSKKFWLNIYKATVEGLALQSVTWEVCYLNLCLYLKKKNNLTRFHFPGIHLKNSSRWLIAYLLLNTDELIFQVSRQIVRLSCFRSLEFFFNVSLSFTSIGISHKQRNSHSDTQI